MRVREGAITPKERAFARVFAATGDAEYAREKSGLVAVGNVLARPRVLSAIETIRETLRTQGAELGVRTLMALCDEKIPPGVRRAAGSDLVKYSGISGLDEQTRKELHEMTLEELDRRGQELRAERANLAKTIEHEPVAQSAPKHEPDLGVLG